MSALIRSSAGMSISDIPNNYCQHHYKLETVVKSLSKSWNPFNATININEQRDYILQWHDTYPPSQETLAQHLTFPL